MHNSNLKKKIFGYHLFKTNGKSMFSHINHINTDATDSATLNLI